MQMPDDILNQHLREVFHDRANPEESLISKLMCIKKVVHGSPIYFTERQTLMISRKYDDFALTRKDLVRLTKKQDKINRIMQEERQKMPFNPTFTAKGMPKSSSESNLSYTNPSDRLYQQSLMDKRRLETLRKEIIEKKNYEELREVTY